MNNGFRISLLAALFAAQHAAAADKMDGLAACVKAAEYRLQDVKRWPAGMQYRTVETASGAEKVSVQDGLRALVFAGAPVPTANLKIEQSAPAEFESDRKAIRAQMELLASRYRGNDKPKGLESAESAGIEVLTLENPSYSPGHSVGMYTLLYPAGQTIATIYMFGQPTGEGAAYNNLEEFRAYRTRFLAAIGSCMQKS